METLVEDKEEQEREEKIVGVRFKPCGRVYAYLAGEEELSPGTSVVVESLFGITIGTVVNLIEDRDEVPKELKRVIRIATEEDFKQMEENKELAEEARRFCIERVMARGIPMKLVAVEVTLDRKRIIFYFTADGRIDFRELVKDLASRFRTRIEMRQIGVRDEAKLIGGIGICGRTLCCNTFLVNFAPISIKMAKEQELALNTTKLSGVCGRLMCCLGYEYSADELDGSELVKEEISCLCEECEPVEIGGSDSLVEETIEDVKEDETGMDVTVLTEEAGHEAGTDTSVSETPHEEKDTGKKRWRRKGRRKRGKRKDTTDSTANERTEGEGQKDKKPLKTKKGHSKHKRKKKKRR